jgi:hypothetical protein
MGRVKTALWSGVVLVALFGLRGGWKDALWGLFAVGIMLLLTLPFYYRDPS